MVDKNTQQQMLEVYEKIAQKLLEVTEAGPHLLKDPYLFGAALLHAALETGYMLGMTEETIMRCVREYYQRRAAEEGAN